MKEEGRERGREEKEENKQIFQERKGRTPCITGQKWKDAISLGPFPHRN
jgi:hypothetical protein